MQILNRMTKDGLVQVRVKKIWQERTGIQIVLTPEGDYVTGDGKPIEDPRLFGIDSMSSVERKEAEAWWRHREDRKGVKTEDKEKTEPDKQETRPEIPDSSAATISAALDAMRRNQEEFFARLAGLLAGNLASTPEAPPLKAVYTRQKGDAINSTAPKNWDEFGFTEKPDWWGVEAERVETLEDGKVYTYRCYWVPDDQGGDERGD